MINVQCSFEVASCQFLVRQNIMHRRRCCILYICTCSTWSKIAAWVFFWGGGGVRGLLNKDLPDLLKYHFWQKGTLSYTVHWKMVPFLTCLLNKKNPENRKPSCHFCVMFNKLKWYSHKVRFWKHFKLRHIKKLKNDRFSNPFINFICSIPYPLIYMYLIPRKRYPFWAEPPCIKHCREWPPPPWVFCLWRRVPLGSDGL